MPGVTRNETGGREVVSLTYDAYPEMARPKLEEIARRALEEFEICAVAAVHRIATLPVGEASVGIAVSAPGVGVLSLNANGGANALARQRPERIVGLHYFVHPAQNRLLEVIPGPPTSPAAPPVKVKDRKGFLAVVAPSSDVRTGSPSWVQTSSWM